MTTAFRLLARLSAAALSLPLLAAPALATWSIVVVNTRTGEACVASATCLPNFPLKLYLPVVFTERGVAAAQSVVDTSAVNRQVIWNGLAGGLSPAEILDLLETGDPGHQSRQYGIVDFANDPVTFTGTNCGKAAAGASGVVGDLRYAVQGNVLTGDLVVLAAEQALLQTEGDLSQRVMAAMEVARRLGGDGRCSCTIGNPTGCGVPPPSFTKSAHTAFVVLTRVGDRLGVCTPQKGCANGQYFLTLINKGGPLAPDPVLVLESMYDQWRLDQAGRPDQVHSYIAAQSSSLPSGGQSSTTVEIELADLDGGPVPAAGLDFSLELVGGAAPVTQPGAFVHLGGGRWRFTLTAGSVTGTDAWRVWVEDDLGRIALQPDVTVDVVSGVGNDGGAARARPGAPPAFAWHGDPHVPAIAMLATPATGFGSPRIAP